MSYLVPSGVSVTNDPNVYIPQLATRYNIDKKFLESIYKAVSREVLWSRTTRRSFSTQQMVCWMLERLGFSVTQAPPKLFVCPDCRQEHKVSQGLLEAHVDALCSGVTCPGSYRPAAYSVIADCISKGWFVWSATAGDNDPQYLRAVQGRDEIFRKKNRKKSRAVSKPLTRTATRLFSSY